MLFPLTHQQKYITIPNALPLMNWVNSLVNESCLSHTATLIEILFTAAMVLTQSSSWCFAMGD